MSEDEKRLSCETLDFLFEQVREAPERQLRDVEAHDSKTVQVFSVASVVIGLLGFTRADIAPGWGVGLAIAAAGAYGVVVIASVLELLPRRYRVTRHADQLWHEHWWDTVENTKHALVEDAAMTYAHNKGVLRRKTRMLGVALVAAGVQAGLVAAALIVSATS